MCRAPGSARDPAARCLLGLVLCCAGMIFLAAEAPAQTPKGSDPAIPRFASLKSDKVQLHHGPGPEFPIAWVFRRAGLPIEITRESEGWCEIRDAEGTTGWVWTTALSRRRTALVLPWEVKAGQSQQTAVALRDDDRESAQILAHVEAGVLASIIDCNGQWCRVSVEGFRGYVEQGKLWGTRKGEVIK